MSTRDLKRQFTGLYAPSTDAPSLVTVPLAFLMTEGHGDPNTSQEYADDLSALYAVAYTAKFMLKKGAAALDYPVMPLERLWWAEKMADFTAGNKANWD